MPYGSSPSTWNGMVTLQQAVDDGSHPPRLPMSFMVTFLLRYLGLRNSEEGAKMILAEAADG